MSRARVLVAGLDDIGSGQLPLTLPGGCLLEVEPATVQFLPDDAPGVAFYSLPLPANLALIGTVLHVRWVLYDPAGQQTSRAIAYWIGT